MDANFITPENLITLGINLIKTTKISQIRQFLKISRNKNKFPCCIKLNSCNLGGVSRNSEGIKCPAGIGWWLYSGGVDGPVFNLVHLFIRLVRGTVVWKAPSLNVTPFQI